MTVELGLWHEVSRTLHDGTRLRIAPASNRPDLVFVQVTTANGAPLFNATLPILDALAEIPYLLDRARVVDQQIIEANRRSED